MVRAFNHIGAGQGKNFVVADFASKIVEIEKEQDEQKKKALKVKLKEYPKLTLEDLM